MVIVGNIKYNGYDVNAYAYTDITDNLLICILIFRNTLHKYIYTKCIHDECTIDVNETDTSI